MLYYFARANQMEKHKFTDDVAICVAVSKKNAIKKFNKLYENVLESEVFRVSFSRKYPTILTDY